MYVIDRTSALLEYLPSFWFHAKFCATARAQVCWRPAKRHSRVACRPDHVCQHVSSTHTTQSLRAHLPVPVRNTSNKHAATKRDSDN